MGDVRNRPSKEAMWKTVPKHEGPLLSGSKHPSGSGDQWADQSREPGQLDTGYTGYILYGTKRLRTCDMALSMAEGLVDCFHARVGELLMASWLGGKKGGSPEPHRKTAMMVWLGGRRDARAFV